MVARARGWVVILSSLRLSSFPIILFYFDLILDGDLMVDYQTISIARAQEDYDDFERKYGSDVDSDNYAKRMFSLYRFNTMGLLLKKGHIDAETLFTFESGNYPLFHWTKFESVIKEQRRRYNIPNFCVGFEYLANEPRKYLERQGFSSEVPETFLHYVPEE